MTNFLSFFLKNHLFTPLQSKYNQKKKRFFRFYVYYALYLDISLVYYIHNKWKTLTHIQYFFLCTEIYGTFLIPYDFKPSKAFKIIGCFFISFIGHFVFLDVFYLNNKKRSPASFRLSIFQFSLGLLRLALFVVS